MDEASASRELAMGGPMDCLQANEIT